MLFTNAALGRLRFIYVFGGTDIEFSTRHCCAFQTDIQFLHANSTLSLLYPFLTEKSITFFVLGVHSSNKSSSMDRLSLDLIMSIASFLHSDDLLNFAATSRTCREASAAYRYQRLQIPLTGPLAFAEAVAKCNAILYKANAFRFVQHLQVVTPSEKPIPLTFNETNTPSPQAWVPDPCIHQGFPQSDSFWDLLGILIENLPALKNLYWISSAFPPLRIIRLLNTVRYGCWLHVYGYEFDLKDEGWLSTYALELATSPCLRSMACYGLEEWEPFREHKTVMNMIAGAAPNLKEVTHSYRMTSIRVDETPRSLNLYNTLRDTLATPRGSLRSLSLGWTSEYLSFERLIEINDFGHLEMLLLDQERCIDELTWLTDRSIKFPRLKHLCIGGRDSREESAWNAIVGFILKLPPLEELKLPKVPYNEQCLVRTIKHCGLRLRYLKLGECFVEIDFVEQLCHYCPYMERLEINVHRHASSRLELRLYQQLASLVRLEQLQLRIRSHQASSNRSLSRGEQYPLDLGPNDIGYRPRFESSKLTRMYLTLKDLAFDKKLASSIFIFISKNKPAYARRLAELTLLVDMFMDTVYDYVQCEDGIRTALTTIVHSWYIVGSTRDDSPFGHTMRSIRFSNDNNSLFNTGNHCASLMNDPIRGVYAPAINQVWPESRERPLREVWHSFPLCTDDEQSTNTASFSADLMQSQSRPAVCP